MNFDPIQDFVKDLKVPVNDLSKNLLDKPTKEIGEGVGNLIWLVFSPILAARNALESKIRQYKTEIETEIGKIPPEKIVPPPLNIVGPALEASKFHIEHEEIRLMFAKLIAASMNEDKQPKTHPSFIEIIKQLTPFDAKILYELSKHQSWPVACIDKVVKESNNFITWIYDVFPFPELNLKNYRHFSTAIQNLTRLSLINIDYNSFYTNEKKYQLIMEHPIFIECQQFCENNQNHPNFQGRYITVKRGIWNITDFGKQFIDCCV